MDSMRHLSTSLPTTRRRQDQPELLSDFKAAALSVTNLYKTAAASQDRARAAGYQDALDDLLAFLDRENLGLMDGEGWRVRQWATERLADDGTQKQEAGSDDDGDVAEAVRSSSPEVPRKPAPAPALAVSSSELTEETSSRRTAVSEPPQQQLPPAQLPSQDAFTFRSSHAYPSNHDREGNNMDLDTTATSTPIPTSTQHSNITTTTEPPAVRIVSRQHNRVRHTNHNRRAANGASTINLNLGAGAGSKRKLPYSDFFDISGLNFDGSGGRDGKDFGSGGGGGRGGGKRGRHV